MYRNHVPYFSVQQVGFEITSHLDNPFILSIPKAIFKYIVRRDIIVVIGETKRKVRLKKRDFYILCAWKTNNKTILY